MLLLAALLAMSPVTKSATTTSPFTCDAPLNGVPVVIEQRFEGARRDDVEGAFFSSQVGESLAARTKMRRRDVVEDRVDEGGVRHRRVRLWLPSPGKTIAALPGVPEDDALFYDEVLTFDVDTHTARFHVVTSACDSVKYGGTIRFIEDGDDVVVHVEALLDFDAPIVGAILEPLVIRGVRDGYAQLATLVRKAL